MWAVGLGPTERVGAAHVVLPSLTGVHWTELREKLTAVSAELSVHPNESS